jgi:class I fructose-bisphosphate aldolase
MEAGAREFAGQVPLILKLNSHDVTLDEGDPTQALTGHVDDAVRLGCAAIGFTIYPGSEQRFEMYGQLRNLAHEAKRRGLAVVVWSYPRGSVLKKEDETAIDICAYAAHIAAQLGAHIVKVKLPTAHIAQDAARKVYEAQKVPITTLTERVAHVVQSTFAGRRIVIFSGGAFDSEETLLHDVQAIHAGGGFGSIMGRNTFQRPHDDAVRMIGRFAEIYAGPPGK